MSPIDLERFRARSAGLRNRPIPSARPKSGVRFLKGPIPLPWLEAAARLPGRSLHVGIALWYAAGLTRTACVTLSNVASTSFGIDRNAKYRALACLERAGLVAVERKLGRAPMVTIVEPAPCGEPLE